MVVDRLSSGNISCNETSSTVVFSFEMIPLLQGYSATNGEMKWKSRLKGFHFADVIETDKAGRSRLTYKVSEQNIRDQMLPAITLKDEHEILQVQRRILPDEGFKRKSEVLTFLLNSTTGKGDLMSRDIPSILNISRNLAVSVSKDNMSFKLHKIERMVR
jgi:hypothetical protein